MCMPQGSQCNKFQLIGYMCTFRGENDVFKCIDSSMVITSLDGQSQYYLKPYCTILHHV